MVQKRSQDLASKIKGCVAVKFDRTQRAAVAYFLSVMPWAENKIDHIVFGILWFDGFVNGRCPVYVLLVPKAVDKHNRYLERQFCEDLVDRLITPVRIVTRVLGQ